MSLSLSVYTYMCVYIYICNVSQCIAPVSFSQALVLKFLGPSHTNSLLKRPAERLLSGMIYALLQYLDSGTDASDTIGRIHFAT